MKLLWLTDLHLDKAGKKRRQLFYDKLREQNADAVVITGDISNARLLPTHLKELGQACAPRTVYFCLGNHDFYGGSFAKVDKAVEDVCRIQINLRHLGGGEIIRLGNNAALVGHRGWADGRAGYGSDTCVPCYDVPWIQDLQCRSGEFGKMAELGKASGNYFRTVLPYALQCYDHVWLATHVPPFSWAAFYNGKPCSAHHQPHYSNFSAGVVIQGIAASFRGKRVTVLCGHTHSHAAVCAGPDFWVYAGAAQTGRPEIQRVFDL